MHKAVPIEAGFFNKDMGTSYNVHRCVMSDANRAFSSRGNDSLDVRLKLHWEHDDQGNIAGG